MDPLRLPMQKPDTVTVLLGIFYDFGSLVPGELKVGPKCGHLAYVRLRGDSITCPEVRYNIMKGDKATLPDVLEI